MLLALEPVPLAELPVPELLLPVLDPVPVPDIDPPAAAPLGRIFPVISTWLFTYSFNLSFWLPPTSTNLSPMLLVPAAGLVADPLVPVEAASLPIFAFARMYFSGLEALDAELLDPVAAADPVPDVPAVPAVSALCRQPVTVTGGSLLAPCWLAGAEPVCAFRLTASAAERIVPNTTLLFIYTP